MRGIPNLGMIVPNMGKKSSRAVDLPLAVTRIAGALFTPVQQRVLGLLFGQPERRYQGNELIRLAGSGTGAVHRVVTRLAEAGLVTVERVGNQKHYQANRRSPVFEELRGLVTKTAGLAIPLRDALAPLAKNIDAAFVYGSLAKGTDRAGSDVDLMVISRKLEYPKVFEALQKAEAALGRTVNPNLITPQEWRRKRAEADSFAARVAAQPRIFVIGSDDELG
jgi:predicted nucleotidyltransferase